MDESLIPYPEMRFLSRQLLKVLKRVVVAAWLPTSAFAAENPLCEASPEIRQEIEKGLSVPAAPNGALEEVSEALRSLRQRFPRDLFVHIGYQDFINQKGVEGHLKEMLEEYEALKAEHPDDPFYLYLYGRALEGRNTPGAISTMAEVLNLDPSFVPSHRTLAEIYASARFRDRKKEKEGRAKFADGCPNSVVSPRPGPLPPPGDLSKAEQLVSQGKADGRVPELVHEALQLDAWRLQRIRSFDWYTFDEKKNASHQAQLKQWRGWSVLVRYYRNSRQEENTKQLLQEMQGRLEHTSAEREPDLYWTAVTTLAELYIEGKQPDNARETLIQMQRFLAKKPDRKRSVELARLRSKSRLSARRSERGGS